MNIDPTRLQWPAGTARTAAPQRSRFTANNITDAAGFLTYELRQMGADRVTITSNVPRGAAACEADPGVAVWFVHEDAWRVLACDRWLTPGDNLRALGLTAQAMRGLERWGVSDVVGQAMMGFRALALGDGGANVMQGLVATADDRAIATAVRAAVGTVPAGDAWRAVLGAAELGDDLPAIKQRYRKLAAIVHPDKGRAAEYMKRLNAAMEAAERELGVRKGA